MIETVKLRNGTTETKPLVATVRFAMDRLMESTPIAIYDLTMICRDRSYKPFGKIGPDLQALSLGTMNPDGTMSVHESIRNIVLSSVEGDGMDMQIVDPVI